jgi:glutathione S-transferase
MTITLHQRDISPFCDKIRRALRWKGLKFETREVSLLETRSRYRKLNPIGKVPCLEHDGVCIADSTDITYYLDEKYPERPLVPRDPAQRGLVHMIEDWADESLYFYEMKLRFDLPHNLRRWLPELMRDDNALMRWVSPVVVARAIRGQLHAQGIGRKPLAMVLRELDRHLDAIDGWLANARGFIAGDTLTIADLAVFAQLYCIQGAQEGVEPIKARPHVVAWMGRVDAATAGPSKVAAA